TDDTALVLSGSNESGSTVNVYNGASLLGAAIVSSTSWSYTATVANGTTYQFNVKETDAAGNTSAATSNFAVTGDTTAPTTTISDIDISADTGTSASDFLTKTASQTITGTLSTSLVTGEILYGSVDAGVSYTDVTSKVSGAAITWDGATLSGTSSIKFKVTDAVGNDGSVATQAYELDTDAPTLDSSTPADNATGIAIGDNIVLTFDENIQVGTGDIVISDGSDTRTIAVGNAQVNFSGSTVTINPTADLNNNSTYYVQMASGVIKDEAGNDYVGISDTTTLNFDTVPAAGAPTTIISGIDIAFDTGASNADFLTKTASQVISGTLSASLVTGEILYGSVNGGTSYTDVTSKVSGTDIDWGYPNLVSGSSSIKFKVTKDGVDGIVATQDYELDTTAPTSNFSTVTDDIGGVTGTLSSGDTTDDAHPVLSGTCDPGSTVKVYDGATLLGTAVVTDTSWEYTATVANGVTYQFNAIETDLADNTGTATSNFSVTGSNVDNTPTTTISNIGFNTDGGISDSDLITWDHSQTITATLSEPLAADYTLHGSVNSGVTWVNLSHFNFVSGVDVSWGEYIVDGTNDVMFKVINGDDVDGPVASQTYVLDQIAPATTVSIAGFSADSGSSDSDFITNIASQTITGTLGASLVAGEYLYGLVDNGSTWTDITSKVSGTTFSWDGATLIEGSGYIRLQVEDTAGNHGPQEGGVYELDLSAPTLTSSTPADDATDFSSASNITLTFDDDVMVGTGNILISDGAGDTRTIAVGDDTQVSISGDTLTINPTADLNNSSTYNVQMASGVIKDVAGNDFAGISDTTTLNFTTFAGETANTTIVVFDLVQGVSSSHSGRTFDANVNYTIYIAMHNTTSALSTAGDGPGSWGLWNGGANLGSDDKVIVAGNGAGGLLGSGGGVFGYMMGSAFVGAGSYIAKFNNGTVHRYAQDGHVSKQLWSGAGPTALDNPPIINTMPSTILLTQGLA
ncbi:MAG: Ig-like domain-containing protein, partial [Sedimenticola sp.]